MEAPKRGCRVCGGKLHSGDLCGVHYTRQKSLAEGIPPSPTRDMNLAERLTYYSKLDTATGCVEFTGYRDSDGYGRITVDGVRRCAHREAYQLAHGPVGGELQVLHDCDNPSCINPKHLRVGTCRDNMEDKVRKGRQANGERNGQSRLSDTDVVEIKRDTRMLKFLAADYGVSIAQVSRIRRGKSRVLH